MTDGTCTVPDCVKPLGRSRATLCEMHYYRLRRNGTLDKVRVRKSCTICGAPVMGHGLCQSHYMQARRADPSRPRCEESGCSRAVEARGFCGYHYQSNCRSEWLRANRQRPEHREIIARWRQANPERMAELHRQWKAANRELVREASRRHSSVRRARKYGAEYEDVNFAALLAEHGMICHLCGGEIDNDLEWDHVIPLARGGTHTSDNLRPSHAFCNRSKGARLTA